MAEQLIFQGVVETREGPAQYDLIALYRENDQRPSVLFSGTVRLNNERATVNIVADLLTGAITLNLVLVPHFVIACLIKCLGEVSLTLIFRCFDWNAYKFLDCLKARGVKVPLEYLACVGACIGYDVL